MEYILFKYREKFGLTPDQLRRISLVDLQRDLEIWSIEADASEKLNEWEKENSQDGKPIL